MGIAIIIKINVATLKDTIPHFPKFLEKIRKGQPNILKGR